MSKEGWAQAVLLAGGLTACILNPGWILIFALWILPVVCAIGLGISRDRQGWAWGLILSWLGVLILACMRPVAKE